MTWTKLSDDFTDDCWTLSDEGFRLHTDGLVWSNRKLLDCVISKEDVRRFAKRPDAVQELLAAGYWSDVGDSYVIRHHAQYQRKREAVIKQQEANAVNGSKGGKGRTTQAGKPREQIADLVPNSSVPPSGSLSESSDKRDRTGQELALYKGTASAALQSGDGDAPPDDPEFCLVCGKTLDSWSTSSLPGKCLGCRNATEAPAMARPGLEPTIIRPDPPQEVVVGAWSDCRHCSAPLTIYFQERGGLCFHCTAKQVALEQ